MSLLCSKSADGFPLTLESNQSFLPWTLRSNIILSEFITYYSLPSSLCSVTWIFLLFCQCMEHTSASGPLLRILSPAQYLHGLLLYTSWSFLKYPLTRETFTDYPISAAILVLSVLFNLLYYFFVALIITTTSYIHLLIITSPIKM